MISEFYSNIYHKRHCVNAAYWEINPAYVAHCMVSRAITTTPNLYLPLHTLRMRGTHRISVSSVLRVQQPDMSPATVAVMCCRHQHSLRTFLTLTSTARHALHNLPNECSFQPPSPAAVSSSPLLVALPFDATGPVTGRLRQCLLCILHFNYS